MPDELDTPFSLLKAYDDGMPGYISSPRDTAEFLEGQRYQYYEEPNIKGSGIGKRALLWQYALTLDPGAYSERQTTGDCVSFGSRGCRDAVRAVQLLVNREPASWYKRTATEPTYGARGHGGQGMSPAKAAKFERDVGFLARKDYGVVDLSTYDSRIGARWGRTGVPSDVQKLCNENKVGRITLIRSQSDLMDAMFNGYAACSGQYAAWQAAPSKRNVHERAAKGWNHMMLVAGYDSTHEYWPFTVWFIINSWGPWNQPVKDWPKDYPPQVPGMIVTSDEDFDVCVKSGDCWVYGSIDGYPPQHLPDYGAIGMLKHGE